MMQFPKASNLRYDISAGIVVFLVALPLCLGVALASGAPLFSGLVAGIVGGVVVSLLSGSQLSVSGPAAGLTTLVFGAVNQLGSFEVFLFSALIAGAIQLVFGLVGAGKLGSFIPNSVIRGMLVSIGLILIIKQIPHAVGYGADLIVDETYSPQSPGSLMSEIMSATKAVSLGASFVCLDAILIILGWEWMAKRGVAIATWIPGPLLAVVWGVLFEYWARGTNFEIAGQHLVTLPEHESFQHLLTSLPHPDFSQWMNPDVYQIAFTIAVVASIETLLSLEAVDRLDPLKRKAPSNQELKAQGIGNMTSALLGGLPITSVIVRSSANVNAGAQSRFSSFVHGVLLLVSVIYFAKWMNSIPLATLAAILLVTGYKLANPKNFIEMYLRGHDQWVPFLVTVAAILIDDLLKGIVIGTIVGLIYIVKTNFICAINVKKKDRNCLVRFRKDVTFLNKERLRDILGSIDPESELMIDASLAAFIDSDILDCIIDFNDLSKAKNIHVSLRNVLRYSGPLNDDFITYATSARRK